MSMWIRCYTLLFCYCFWMQILLLPMLCIVIAHKVLSWDLGLSVLDAPLLCKSMCEKDAVKGNREEVGRNSSLDFYYYNLVWKPWLWQLTQPWKGPMCFSSSLAGGEPPTPLGKPKFPWGNFLAEQPLGSLAASCSGTLLGTGRWLWGLRAGFGGSWDSFHPIL